MGGKKKKTKQVNRFALLTSVKFRLVSLKTFYKRKKKKRNEYVTSKYSTEELTREHIYKYEYKYKYINIHIKNIYIYI